MNSSKLHSSLVLTANLNFADLEGGFNFNSSTLGVIGFLFCKLKHLTIFSLMGAYLDELLSSE